MPDRTYDRRPHRNKIARRIKHTLSKKKTCHVCGRDPYPNYFYCPFCHEEISKYEFSATGSMVNEYGGRRI